MLKRANSRSVQLYCGRGFRPNKHHCRRSIGVCAQCITFGNTEFYYGWVDSNILLIYRMLDASKLTSCLSGQPFHGRSTSWRGKQTGKRPAQTRFLKLGGTAAILKIHLPCLPGEICRDALKWGM